MSSDPRQFLEDLAMHERSSWIVRARHLYAGPSTLVTSYSVYLTADGRFARAHTKPTASQTSASKEQLDREGSRWVLIGFLRSSPHRPADFALVERGRAGDKAVFWLSGSETQRFVLTSRLIEDPRRVQVRPITGAPAAGPLEMVVQVPQPPPLPSEWQQSAPTPSGVLAIPPRPLPKTLPPPRRAEPRRPSVSPLPLAMKRALRSATHTRLPLPSQALA